MKTKLIITRENDLDDLINEWREKKSFVTSNGSTETRRYPTIASIGYNSLLVLTGEHADGSRWAEIERSVLILYS